MLFTLAKMATTPEQKMMADTMFSRLKFDYLYLTNYFPGITLHGWSLSLEEQFYIFFPMFLLLVFRYLPTNWRFPSLVVLYFIPLFARIWVYVQYIQPMEGDIMHTYEAMIYKPFHTHADSIFAGIILAFIIEHKKEWLRFVVYDSHIGKWIHAGAWTLLFSFNLFSYELSKSLHNQVFRFTINNISTFIILLYCMRPGLITNFLSFKIFSPIAKLSYIAYLLHMLLLGYLMYPLARKPEIAFSDILIYWIPFSFVIFFVSYIFHLGAERPFMYLKDYITAQYKKEAISRI
jgi:peptidoglycan/LPS O-acetylase OafA/YrhL